MPEEEQEQQQAQEQAVVHAEAYAATLASYAERLAAANAEVQQ